jgi:hypothetical protein
MRRDFITLAILTAIFKLPGSNDRDKGSYTELKR